MTGNVEAQRAHVELVGEARGQRVAQLHLAQLGVGAVLDEVAGGAAFVAGVVGGQSGNLRRSVGCRPSIEHAVTLVRAGVGDGVEVGLELLVVVDILSGNALPEHREVEVLVAEFEVQTPREVGHGREDPRLVLLVDEAVAVEVGILQTTHAGILLTAGQHFLTVLEQAVDDVAHDGAIGTLRLNEVLLGSVHVGTCSGLRQVGHLRAEEVEVAVDVVAQAVARGVTIAHGELHTPVLQAGTVEPRSTTFTHRTEVGRIDEHVLHLLHVSIHGTVERVAEERVVETEVVLLSGLPLQVVVLRLCGTEARGEHT